MQNADTRSIPEGAWVDPKSWALHLDLIDAVEERKWHERHSDTRVPTPDSAESGKIDAGLKSKRISASLSPDIVARKLNRPNDIRSLRGFEEVGQDDR